MRFGITAAFGAALALAGPGAAQDVLRERTGPAAQPQPLPAYPTPQPGLVARPPAVTTDENASRVRFADIVVTGDTGRSAPRRAGWSPSLPNGGEARLSPPGATGLDADWVRRQFTENALIGRPVALDSLVAVVQAINLAFVENGYINSGILLGDGEPVDGATLEIRLVFGTLAQAIDVRWGPGGSRGLDTGFVADRMPSATRAPLDANALERDFRLLTEDPAIRTVAADLRPGANPGEATLALTVDPAERVDLYLTAANSRSPSIGGERFAIGGSLRNLAIAGDIVSAEGGLTGGRPDISGGYATPFLSPRTALSLRGSYSDAAVIDRPLRPLDIKAREWSVEGGLTETVFARPLTPIDGGWRPARSLRLGILGTHRQTRSFLLGEPFSFSPGSVRGRAEYSALRLTADFTERGIGHVTALSLTATQGLEGTRGDVPGIDTPDPNFRTLLAQASHARRLAANGLELRLRLTGQIADGILYSGERLAAGGEYTVRGYRETLALADIGVIGSVEVAQPFSIGGGGRSASGTEWGAFTASVFADGAVLENRRDPQPLPRTLASVGVSLAWTPSEAISARIVYGAALKEAPASGSRDLQDDGVSFRMTLRPLLLLRRR